MAFQLCGVFIDGVPSEHFNEGFPPKQLQSSLPIKLDTLSPKRLSVGFVGNATIILLDMLFYKNISNEAALTPLEKDIASLFPDKTFFIILIDDVNNSYAYSFIIKGVKYRTKANFNGQLFIDYGDLLPSEVKKYDAFVYTLKQTAPHAYEKAEEAFRNKDEVEKKKAYLILRDKITKGASEYQYSTGKSDEEACERFIYKMCGINSLEIEETVRFVQFEKTKLNFKKESIRDYLFHAWNIVREN